MPEPIEDTYFKWLYSNVGDINAHLPQLRFFNLFAILHQTEFVFLISGDDNRVEDGRDLRTEFLHEKFIHDRGELSNEGCSVFEMLIAFSRRASFATDDSPKDWFWVMINNLGLASFNDAVPIDDQLIANVLERLIWRTYDIRGNGGLFPLSEARKNQRKVEIWYQFNSYLVELNYD